MSSGKRTLVQDVARYMDNEAFTAKRIGKAKAEHMRKRRRSAERRAAAAVRFFKIPGNLERLQKAIQHQGAPS